MAMDQNPHDEFLKWYEPLHDRFVRYCSSKAFGFMETEDLVQESILITRQTFRFISTAQEVP